MAKIKTKATIEKVTRAAGKAEAQATITFPVSLAADMPVGAVTIEVETLQSAMFGNKKAKK
jgi:hypothetical protein